MWRIIGWYGIKVVCYLYMVVFHRYRVWGVRHIPRTGPVLFVSNHQSFFDPVLVGMGAHRRQFYSLARATLFRNPLFAGWIRFLNATPVDQEKSDIVAMRKCIDLLKDQQALMIFPEGARTLDGTTDEFATGVMLVIKRAKPTIIPVAIEGAFDVWPRVNKAPKLWGRIGVMYGEPFTSEELLAGGTPEEALGHLRERVEAMRLEVRDRMAR